jgi:endonuclease YncB( thermonuclease family)
MYKTRNIIFIFVALIALIFAAVFFVSPNSLPKITNQSNSTMQDVSFGACIDGDTAKYKDTNGKAFNVRYSGINTPESRTDTKLGIKEEKFGKEAKEYSCQKIKNAQKLQYEDDPSQESSYEREIGTIFYDGKNLSVDLVENGYASTKYLKKGNPHYDELKTAEQNAQKNKKGIWS